MGPVETEEKQGLLGSEIAFDTGNNAFVHSAWGRRDPSQRTHTLWNMAKITATLGSLGLLAYSLITLFGSMKHLLRR